MAKQCCIDGCGREARYVSTQMCQKHHRNMRVHGTPEAPKRKRTPVADLIAAALARGLAAAVEVGDCLEWQGYFMCEGVMPAVKARNAEKDRTDNFAVTRLLWEQNKGPVPPGKLVYRKCCNNACVKLVHLACGTRKQWHDHRTRMGVHGHDEATKIRMTIAARKRSTAVNSMEKAREVRQLKAARVPVAQIALSTGVSHAMVEDICGGHAWRELGSPFAGLGA